MKIKLLLILFLTTGYSGNCQDNRTRNIVLISIDGYRWQENNNLDEIDSAKFENFHSALIIKII